MAYKSKKRLFAVSVMLLIMIGLVSFCFAAYTGISGIKNTFTTGGVNIGVEEYTKTASGETVCRPVTKVRSGGTVSYIPRITSYAEDCYIRVRLGASTQGKRIDIMNNCLGIKNGWIEKGNYAYYEHPLSQGQSADLCNGFSVTENWDFRKCNEMTVCIQADAIQAKNFMPDFSAEEPWGSVSVKKSYISGYKSVNEVQLEDDDGIRIIFEKSADRICADRKKMFDNISLMPGDSRSDRIRIRNMSQERAEVMFKAVCEKSALMDDLDLEINNGDLFYKGVLSGDKLREYRKIAEIEPGETKEISFDIGLSAEKDNDAQLKKGQATWYFMLGNSHETETGDRNCLWVFSVICLLSIIMTAVVLRRGRHEGYL